jgi:hypothetical protein
VERLALTFLFVILLCSLFVGNVTFGASKIGTDIGGIIAVSQTWTKAGSPYSLTGPTQIADGVTVTLEPGASLDLNANEFEVDGAFVVRGTSTDRPCIDGGFVQRTWEFGSEAHNGYITFTSASKGWDEKTGAGSIIENANISANIGSDVSLMVRNNFIESYISVSGSSIVENNFIVDGGIYVDDGSPIISGNVVMNYYGQGGNGISIDGGAPTVENNIVFSMYQGMVVTAQNGEGGLLGSNQITIKNNTIANCTAGVFGASDGTITFEDNLVINNGVGMSLGSYGSAFDIKTNTFANNNLAISFDYVYANSQYTDIHNNNFVGNEENIDWGGEHDLDATSNWWGTTDANQIGKSIYDGKNDYHLGTVNFTPFLQTANPRAPSIGSFTVPDRDVWLSSTHTSPNYASPNTTSPELTTASPPVDFFLTVNASIPWFLFLIIGGLTVGIVLSLIVFSRRKPLPPPPPP